MEAEQKEKIFKLSYDAVKATGLKNGPTHTEIRFKGDVPYVLETTSRPGAGGIFYEVFEKAFGIDFYNVFYDSLFPCNNNKKAASPISHFSDPNTYYYWFNFSINDQGTIKNIVGIDELKDNPNIITFLIFSSIKIHL